MLAPSGKSASSFIIIPTADLGRRSSTLPRHPSALSRSVKAAQQQVFSQIFCVATWLQIVYQERAIAAEVVRCELVIVHDLSSLYKAMGRLARLPTSCRYGKLLLSVEGQYPFIVEDRIHLMSHFCRSCAKTASPRIEARTPMFHWTCYQGKLTGSLNFTGSRQSAARELGSGSACIHPA